MMQGDELGNTDEENTSAHSAHILKHEKTGTGSQCSPKELRTGLRLYFKEKPKCCLKSFQAGRLL